MRSTRDRVHHAISFELGGLALVSPLGAWAFDLPMADITVVRMACAIIATVWTYVYNLAFDTAIQHMTGGSGKSIVIRVLHAVVFEAGLLAMLTPLMAWYLGISLLQAFLMDVVFALLYVLYAFVFNWAYDRVLGISASSKPGSPRSAPRWTTGWMKGKPA
ncbi:PACE efflux transporter [Microvirga sp. 3-52]|uniref:PACE efflux transporter n=1 Tax=Microvirga sp. 3-52 TaxID=2792425 RepID=UPI001ACACC47|nr:PACE efflux transporter [Microvirga sp. 3-52]MBO1907964.1 PACE efflux transporter [Microvirga sp. 3-52]MBS7454785.1 PACE efflux transporter [Microvirga sp. 3-52]